MKTVKLTSEWQALAKQSVLGMYLANGATDQNLAYQGHSDNYGCYGGFYLAWKGLLINAFGHEDTLEILNRFDLNVEDHTGIITQLEWWIMSYSGLNIGIILL